MARSLGQTDAGIHPCHNGKLLQVYITITVTNCCKYSLLSLWQIAKNIHHCKYGKLLKTDHCNDGKLLKTYTTVNMANCCKPMSLWQIAAYTCYHGKLLETYIPITMADECFQFTADSMGYRNTSADECFWFTADSVCGIQKHFSWWMFSVCCWLWDTETLQLMNVFTLLLTLWDTETLQLMDVSGLLLMKCLWGTETSENSLMKITYSSSLFHMTNNIPSCLPHCYLRSCVLGSSWQMLPTKVT